MSPPPGSRLVLNEPQRRAIGVRLESMCRLLAELRSAGLESETVKAIEQVLGEVASEAAAIVPAPPRSAVHAALAQLLVRALELRPRQLQRYGTLDAEAAAYLDRQSRRLDALVQQLVDEHGGQRLTAGSPPPSPRA